MSLGITYPLQRDGNSQEQRSITAQNPAFAPVDGRKLPDMLNFWSQFSKVVLHTDLNGKMRDWSAFFEQSVPFKLAEIFQYDADAWWDLYQEYRQLAEEGQADGLTLTIGHLFAAFEQHQKWHKALENDDSVVSVTLRNLTATNLKYILTEFSGVFVSLKEKFKIPLQQDISVFFDKDILHIWGLQAQQKGLADKTLEAKKGNAKTIVPHVLLRMDRMAEILYKAQLAIRKEFPQDDFGLEELIAKDGEHQPHVGLMLAFLRVFRVVQGDFNLLTERHLNYFYRDVLLFDEKEAIPDAAHLVLELAKHIPDSYQIKKETGFKDGKDNNKTDIIFNTVDELVLNKAAVAEIRTMFTPLSTPVGGQDQCPPVQQFAPGGKTNVPCIQTALSSDFAPFGNAVESQQGRMGFVLASPVFRLCEGTREVKITLVFTTPPPPATTFTNLISARITTKDKWLPVSVTATSVDASTIDLDFTLTPDFSPIEPLPDTAQNQYGSGEPLLEVLFKFDDDLDPTNTSAFAAFYENLKSNPIVSITPSVIVSGLKKKLILKNDEGNLNPEKAFQAFGTAAAHRLYLGHPDLFGKNISSLNCDLIFDEKSRTSRLNDVYKLYSASHTFDRTAVTLNAAQTFSDFTDIGPLRQNFSIFTVNDESTGVSGLELLSTPLQLTAADNLVALDVIGDAFFHDNYPAVLAKQGEGAVALGLSSPGAVMGAWYLQRPDGVTLETPTLVLGVPTLSLPPIHFNYLVPFPAEPPYNPEIQSFALNYVASGSITTFTQILPFEDSTEQVEIGQKVASTLADTALNTALTPFVLSEAYLYIGLKNAPKQGNVALLFQVSEYTGNADLDLPELTWSVLEKGNVWKKLQKEIDYSDDTEGLAQAGIIRFELPKEASELEHTILPAGFVWLRAEAAKNSAAFDRLMGIHAQAVKAVFAPEPASDLLRLNQPIAKDSLKKMLVDAAQINKIGQPYPSFGGKTPESQSNFFRRVAERLRHKGRGINIWDYEALVLEFFPQIYKAKCLNHTLALRGLSEDFEFLNGYATLVLIPDVSLLPATGRDEPKASQNLLGDITRFLQERVSPFAQVEVLNPRYERIDVCFKVVFMPGIDDAFYTRQLEEDIKNFLSPWRADDKSEIQFGGEIQRSSIIQFVELRNYVDYVSEFYIRENTGPKVPDVIPVFDPNLSSIAAKTARSVLSAGNIYVIPDLSFAKPQ